MTWFTDSIYERLMTEKPNAGGLKKSRLLLFLKMQKLPLQEKVPMHRVLYQKDKRKKL